MSVRLFIILLLVTGSICQHDNVAQAGEAELPVVEAPNDGQPLVGDLELSEPVPEVKVESAQFHPKATNGEDVTPPPTEPEPAPVEPVVESVIESVVEAVVEAVVEPLVIKLEEPVVVKLSDKKDEEPAQGAEPVVEVVKVVEAVKEELEKIEKAVSDQAMESEVEAKPVEQDSDEAVVDRLEEKLVEKLVEVLVEDGTADGLPAVAPVAGPIEEHVAEVIPSFQEFKESQIKKDSDKKENGVKEGSVPEAAAKEVVKKRKKVEKNYADTACGAKIVARNKESKNTGALLNSNRDLYVMNPCEASIWFVVELCDTVQVEALQLANFELFSSSIENFNVFTSSSYPTKQWTQVGPFIAKNNRNLQKFQLETNGEYSKFVKFEKISHYVKEHFCVITTFQVLGTSMVEEYEGQQQPEEEEIDPYEEALDGDKKRIPESGDKSIIAGARNLANNLLDSAMNLLGASSGAAESADNTTNKTVDVILPAIEEKVVVKVDEAGKEIKVELTPADKMRVKGETGDKPIVKPTVVKPVAEPLAKPKPIMEAVDLKVEDVVETNLAEEVVKPIVKPIMKLVVEPVVALEEDRDEVVEQIKLIMKEEDPVQDREATGDREEMKAKPTEEKGKVESDSKGVIMSSSPKKNSIFVELDKKIKDLEYNLSLSNDYLETLSSRYKKVNNLFKPLEKTLSTFDDTMKEFEGRLEALETSISSLNTTIQRQVDVNLDNQESYKNITTSINIILFLLTLLVIMCWRVSSKVNSMQLAMNVQRIPFAPPAPPKRIASDYQLSNIENVDPKSRGRQSFDVIGPKKKKTKQKVKRDPISSAGLLFGESNNISTHNNALKHSKSAESIPIELIYPTSDLYKRKVKFKN